MMRFWKSFLRADRILTVGIALLFCFGATILYSLSLGQADEGVSIVLKQVLFFIAGFGAYVFFMTIDYRLWQPVYPWLYLLCLALLLALFTPFGEVLRDVRSWLDFGCFIWQPVEIIKVLMILSVAGYFSKYGRHLRTCKPLIVSGLAVALWILLSLAHPYCGAAVM